MCLERETSGLPALPGGHRHDFMTYVIIRLGRTRPSGVWVCRDNLARVPHRMAVWLRRRPHATAGQYITDGLSPKVGSRRWQLSAGGLGLGLGFWGLGQGI